MGITNNKRNLLIASFLSALVIASIEYFIFSGGTIYVAQVEWNKVNDMPYKEAQEYLADRVANVSRFQSVINGTTYKEFWLRYIYKFFIYFILAVSSCFIFVYMQNRQKS